MERGSHAAADPAMPGSTVKLSTPHASSPP
jgi:hypothetical protein